MNDIKNYEIIMKSSKGFEATIKEQIEKRLQRGEVPSRILQDVTGIYEALEEPVPNWVEELLNKPYVDNLGMEILRTLELIEELWSVYERGKASGKVDVRVLTEIRFNHKELREMLDLYSSPSTRKDDDIANKIAALLS